MHQPIGPDSLSSLAQKWSASSLFGYEFSLGSVVTCTVFSVFLVLTCRLALVLPLPAGKARGL